MYDPRRRIYTTTHQQPNRTDKISEEGGGVPHYAILGKTGTEAFFTTLSAIVIHKAQPNINLNAQ
jgi:hypothetical protein